MFRLWIGLALCLPGFLVHAQVNMPGVRISMPLKQISLTSAFGYRKHPVTGLWKFHNGVDLAARRDTVFSILDGMVVRSGYDPFLGLAVKVAHGDMVQTIYGHLSVCYVLPGDTLSAGQPLGITGSTGRTTGEHLHFSVRYAGQYLHPLRFLKELLEREPGPGNEQKDTLVTSTRIFNQNQ